MKANSTTSSTRSYFASLGHSVENQTKNHPLKPRSRVIGVQVIDAQEKTFMGKNAHLNEIHVYGRTIRAQEY